jgi:hypothetical protein
LVSGSRMPKSVSTLIITLALVLAASINLGWDFYRLNQEHLERQRIYKESGVIVCTMGASIDVRARMFIELCLIIAFVGSLMKGFKGTLLTVAGLSGAVLFYLLWRQVYFRLAEASGSDLMYVEHIATLIGANYLDIAIAATITFLILLHVKHAVSLFRPALD